MHGGLTADEGEKLQKSGTTLLKDAGGGLTGSGHEHENPGDMGLFGLRLSLSKVVTPKFTQV